MHHLANHLKGIINSAKVIRMIDQMADACSDLNCMITMAVFGLLAGLGCVLSALCA